MSEYSDAYTDEEHGKPKGKDEEGFSALANLEKMIFKPGFLDLPLMVRVSIVNNYKRINVHFTNNTNNLEFNM